MSTPDEGFHPPPLPVAEDAPRAQRPAKLMIFGIVLVVLGVIVAVAGIPKLNLISGGIATGGVMALAGLALIGLSFIPLPALPDTEPPLPFVSKITGIFFEPSRVFRNLRVHPHWVGAWAIIVVLSVIYTFAFVQRITPERIVDHTISKLSEMGPPFAPPPDRLETMRENQLKQLKNPVERVGTVI